VDWYGDEIGSCFLENTLATYESSHHPNRSANLSCRRMHVTAQVLPPSASEALIFADEDLLASADTKSGEQAMAKLAFTGCVSS
jgi:hypothetical protein